MIFPLGWATEEARWSERSPGVYLSAGKQWNNSRNNRDLSKKKLCLNNQQVLLLQLSKAYNAYNSIYICIYIMLIHMCIWLCDVCVQKRMKTTTVKVQQQTWKQTCTCRLSAGFAGQNSCRGILRPWSGKVASLAWFLCYQYLKCVSLLVCQPIKKLKVVFLSSYYVRDKNSNIYIILLYITTIHHNNNNRYNIIIFDHPMMETSQNASIFTWHVEPRGRGSWRRWRNGLRHWRCGCFGYRLSELSDLDRLARRYLVCIYIIYIMLTNNNVYQ